MSAPVPEVDLGLVEMLKSAPDHGGWRAGMDDDDYRDLARAVQAHVEGRVEAAVVGALEGAAVAVERDADGEYAPGGCYYRHQQGETDECNGCAAYATAQTAARIIREQAPGARRSPETASTTDGGREGVRGGDGA